MNKYLKKNQWNYELESNLKISEKYLGVVVIPVLAEFANIEKTLDFLALNNYDLLSQTLIILVINNKVDCSPFDFEDNQQLLSGLRNSQFDSQKKLNLSWIDASSKGCEVRKKTGVGTARKIGMDIALKYLDKDGIIFSLDADTEVESNYLEVGYDFYKKNKVAGAVYNFYHRRVEDDIINDAIEKYEEYLHHYTNQLKRIKSPYAYHSIGSTISCRAKDYVRAGGMRRNEAGEDFYFLQALRKIGEIGNITTSTVYPALRISQRTPYGTGQRLSQHIKGDEIVLYQKETFDLLDELFVFIRKLSLDDFENISLLLNENMPELIILFLNHYQFDSNWEKIYKNTPKKLEKLQEAFFIWFDAFRTLKFIHFVEKGRF